MREIAKLIQDSHLKLGSFLALSPVFAATENGDYIVNISPPEGSPFVKLGQYTLPELVPVIIQIILIVAALIALIFLIVGGIKWITSGGDKTALEGARGTVTSALIGLLIVFAAWALIRLISYLFGLDILSVAIPKVVE